MLTSTVVYWPGAVFEPFRAVHVADVVVSGRPALR